MAYPCAVCQVEVPDGPFWAGSPAGGALPVCRECAQGLRDEGAGFFERRKGLIEATRGPNSSKNAENFLAVKKRILTAFLERGGVPGTVANAVLDRLGKAVRRDIGTTAGSWETEAVREFVAVLDRMAVSGTGEPEDWEPLRAAAAAFGGWKRVERWFRLLRETGGEICTRREFEALKRAERPRRPRKGAKYTWQGEGRNRRRVSLEDGSVLLKTPEAAEVLGVSVDAVRELIRKRKLWLRATYAGPGGSLGWLVSEKDVRALIDSKAISEARRRHEEWAERVRKARARAARPLPVAKVRPMKKRPVTRPDSFQVEAVEAALAGVDVLVSAPTGAGKTWIAEELARAAVADGARFVYASPLKALSNQKFTDFQAMFGQDRVGIVTGDITIRPDAEILVMTTEIYRNQCVRSPQSLHGVKWVALDEFHLLDSDRGAAWEQAVIFSPPEATLVRIAVDQLPNQ